MGQALLPQPGETRKDLILSVIDTFRCMQGGWQNRVLARLANEMSRYNPIRVVPRVQAPVLMVATTLDTLCPVSVARKAAELNSRVQLVLRDAGAQLPFRLFLYMRFVNSWIFKACSLSMQQKLCAAALFSLSLMCTPWPSPPIIDAVPRGS